MFLLSVLSGAIFVLPVAVTIGIFLGVEHQAIFHGNGHVESGWFGGGSGSRISTETFCQKSYGVTPYPGRYLFNPNQWGNAQNNGVLCMNVTSDKAVSEQDLYAADFSATWNYPQGPVEEPVHAFPNAKLLLPNTLPVQVSDLKSLPIDVSWNYGLGNQAHNSTNDTALAAAKLNANVAVDIFAAEEKDSSGSTTDSDYEIMVWLGRWGGSTDPIGLLKGSQATQTINGTKFDLFYGDNAIGQRVFTWVAEKNTTQFTGDLVPLVTTLAYYTGPSSNSYLGYVAFGTEALYSPKNVTFSVSRFEIDVVV